MNLQWCAMQLLFSKELPASFTVLNRGVSTHTTRKNTHTLTCITVFCKNQHLSL